MDEHADCVIITMDLSVSFTYVAVEEVFKLNCMESRWLTSSPAWMQEIPTAVSDVLLTRFGGFVLLTTLLHCSLHTRYGHVLPWI